MMKVIWTVSIAIIGLVIMNGLDTGTAQQVMAEMTTGEL
jgi:hypothetical protein